MDFQDVGPPAKEVCSSNRAAMPRSRATVQTDLECVKDMGVRELTDTIPMFQEASRKIRGIFCG